MSEVGIPFDHAVERNLCLYIAGIHKACGAERTPGGTVYCEKHFKLCVTKLVKINPDSMDGIE